MKKILFFALVFLIGSSYSQTFFSLDGIETPEGETILLYHFGIPLYRDNAPVYKYNTATGYEKRIMNAFFGGGSNTRSVRDFEFFPGDTANFINCGWGYMPDNYAFVAYNDSAVAGFQSTFNHVDISQQNPSLTYASDGSLYRSFDGGLSYPEDSILNFNMISVSDFNDNEMYGIDYSNRLIKSFDGGYNSVIVDNHPVFEDLYMNATLFYDSGQVHIYRINSISYSYYALYVSADNGNPYSWELKQQFPEAFTFSNDKSQSGTCYLGYYYHLYKSTDFAESFTPFHTFEERIAGIYPKLGTQILYVATQHHLYKLEDDSLTTLKEIPPDPDLVNYYPLQVGNLWVYDGYIWAFPDYETYQFVRKVTDEVLKPNQKTYFEIEEYFVGGGYSTKYYERIDSANVKVYRFDEDSVQSGQEYLVDDLRAEVGDTVRNYRFYLTPYAVIYSADTTFYQAETHFKRYNSESLIGNTYDLVKYFGLTRLLNTFDFGSDDRTLKGAIINGILYGDTTTTGVDDEINSVNSFGLSQNYPNPFNPVTTINYSIPGVFATGGRNPLVTLRVFDALGREAAVLVNEEKSSGSYSVKFDGSNLASGIYLYQLRAGAFVQTRKMILLK